MDVALLSRVQFAITVGFHFLFPPITIGLAWALVIIEALAWRKRDLVYDRAGRFFSKLLGLTFAVGVATGIVMEFQFGTNWSRYSRFVGDIFGAPLAAEGVLAFFLESTFLGVYLFARDRIAKKWHFAAILLVAIGATLSAFWIIVANSWMQTPAGYVINHAAGRAELTSFLAAVFNPSTVVRYVHTVTASLVCGAFFLAGTSAYLLLRNIPKAVLDEDNELIPVAAKALKLAVILGLAAAVLVAFPSGHHHARQVAHTQPEKFAAIEGLYTSQHQAPLVMFALPFTEPPRLHAKVEVPGLLSWMAFGDVNARVRGIDEFDPANIPPLWLTFVSFHNMVVLGMFFILVMAYGALRVWRGKLLESRAYLWLLVLSVPLPLAACQFGWVTAEVGRQPWIVYGLMRTGDAFSTTLSAGHLWFSLILFTTVYLLLLALYFYLLFHKLNHAEDTIGAAKPAALVA